MRRDSWGFYASQEVPPLGPDSLHEAPGLFLLTVFLPNPCLPRGAATGWAPWCAAPPQNSQEPKSETQHLCVQYALQDSQLQGQGEERKVWGSRFCHTQMTVCGGLFFRKPRRTPHPHLFSCRLPIVPGTWDSWRRRLARSTPPPPTPRPPYTRRRHGQFLDPGTNSAAPTAGQARKSWCRLVFSSTWAKTQTCLKHGDGALQPEEGQAPEMRAQGYQGLAYAGAASQGRLPLLGLNSFV